MTWELVQGVGCAVDWGHVNRTVIIFILLLRASELFADDVGESSRYILLEKGRYCVLPRGSTGACNGRGEADKIEVRFRGSVGDQEQKGGNINEFSGPSTP